MSGQVSQIKRTIESVLNLETGEILSVNDVFRDPVKREAEIFQFRTLIQQQVHEERAVFVCLYCKQSVGIRGHFNKQDYYLAHTFNSDDCIIKTNHRLTEEQIRCIKYNGVKESDKHNELKNKIAHYLAEDELVNDVQTEKVYKDKAISSEWKKPDVMAYLKGKTIAFELQLSTTFLSVIVSRTLFYKKRGVFLIWIFPEFSVNRDVQLFTQKDVYYNNSFNVYVFDQDAQERSAADNKLVLKCFHKKFSIKNDELSELWVYNYISIHDLQYDHEKYGAFYFDSLAEKQKVVEVLNKQKADGMAMVSELFAKQKADSGINFLREFYQNDRIPFTFDDKNPLDEIKSELEIALFNKALGFNGDKVGVVAKLFENRSKPTFLKFICEQDNILVDTGNLKIDNVSVFEYLVHSVKIWEFYHLMPMIFRKGYVLSARDQQVFDNLFDKNYFNQTDNERDSVEKWAFIYGLKTLWNKEDCLRLVKMRKILFALLSLKFDLSIGQRFANLKQYTMNICIHAPEFGHIYLRGLKRFKQYDKQLGDDKSGKLRAAIDRIVSHSTGQDQNFKHMISEIFPELS